MLVSDATSKTCPFQSNMVHETSSFEGMQGTTVQGWFYCSGEICMSWQAEIPGETGYCKLIEAPLPVGQMGFKITDVHSIELDRTKPFNQQIHLKDKTGYIMESIPVKQNVANETLQLITDKWWAAISKDK